MSRVWLVVLLLFVSCMVTRNKKGNSIELNDGWEFKQKGASEWFAAKVPGTVHTDLLEHDLIPDPFYRNNEDSIKWVEESEWVYKYEFEQINRKGNYELEFEGLDTYADVYLNGELILNADNMFRRWMVDVSSLLQDQNELQIEFHAPVNHALPFYNALDYKLPASNDVGEIKTSVFTRKAGYSYGWDWAPRATTSGIWRPVNLVNWREAIIRDFQIYQKSLSDEKAEILLALEIESDKEQEVVISVEMDDPIKIEEIQLVPGKNIVEIPISISDPKRWWPNGLGEPFLYDIIVKLFVDNAIEDSKTEQLGLRTVELVREKDQSGTAFYFKVNEVPVFMKGANYVPADVFMPRVDEEKYSDIIESAVDANMNMLRVWGGGIYESDAFYDLCDANGLLVWQDFMFACSMYPGDSAFLENVRLEAIDNVKRLRNHPCIALWNGNNEVEVAWNNWGWKDGKDMNDERRATIWNDYKKIFDDILPTVIKEQDPDRFYTPTSPLSNWGTAKNFNHHSMHYWGVWHGEDSFEKFNTNVGRFNSEYGFQSFPDMKNIESFTVKGDRSFDSEVMQKRQKSYKGNGLLFDYMDRWYKRPKDFESFLYVNQLLHAKGMKMAIEAHRSQRPHCMGTLYWQLNDCWPSISWSGIDYYGNWKAAHYQIKESFENLSLFVNKVQVDSLASLEVYFLNDHLDESSGALQVELIGLDGVVRAAKDFTVKAKQNASTRILTMPLSDWIIEEDSSEVFFRFNYVSKANELIEYNYFLAREMNLKLPQSVDFTEQISKEIDDYWIEIEVDSFAKNVYLQCDCNGNFSDNFFDMVPKEKRKIRFEPAEDKCNFRKGFRVRSLESSFFEEEKERK